MMVTVLMAMNGNKAILASIPYSAAILEEMSLLSILKVKLKRSTASNLGQDLLYLADNLSFNDLELQDLDSGDTAIVLKSDNSTLAILQNVTAEDISEADLVISLNLDSRDINIDDFESDRSLIYLKAGLNENIIEVVEGEDNTQIILAGTEEVIATINNATAEDVASNLLEERINFIDSIFTAFNNDSRLASFDYELDGLAPGDYTLRGTAYDHETANKIISQGVTLINPLLEIPDSDKEFVIEDRAYDSETANEIISQNINSSAEAVDSDTGLVELAGNQVIDWIYQVGSENPTNSDDSVSNTFDRARGITTTTNNSGNVNVHLVGETRGLLPNQGTLNNEFLLRPGLPEINLSTPRPYSWYGNLNSAGELRQLTQSFDGDSAFQGEGIASDGGENLYVISNINESDLGQTFYSTRIEQINPATGEVVGSAIPNALSTFKRDIDLALDSSGDLYSIGYVNNESGNSNALLSRYNNEGNFFNSESISVGTDGITQGQAIAIDSEDNIYITGQTTGALVPDISREDSDQFDIWLARYENTESGLEQVWIQQFSLGEVESAADIAIDSQGNVYVIGEVLGIEGGDIVGKDRIWFTKFEANGDRLWTRILDFDSSLADLPKGITIDNSDNIYITGENRTGNPTETGQADVFIAQYDTDSNLIWTQNFGTSANDGVEDLTVDSEGNLYLTGSTLSGLSGQNKGSGDAWVAKFNNLENSNRIERERFILGDSTGNFYSSGNIARITGFDAAIGDTIALHGSSEDYALDTYTVQRQVNGVLRIVETGVKISYQPNDGALPEEIARIVDGNIADDDRQFGLRKTTEFQAGNIDFVSAREDNVESVDFTINNNGTSEDDELIGTADTDVLTGGDGDDFLVGNLGGDYLDGGTGNDILYSGSESSDAEVEPPEDSGTYSFLYGWEGNDELYGSDFADELYGGQGNDVLDGGAGNDTIDGGQGDDVLDGGAGRDVISYRDELASVTISLETGTVNDSQNGTDTFSNIEGAIASEYSDTIIGDANNNILTGLAGDDIINSGAGNDRIEAGQGSDLVDAGAGNDTLINTDGNDTLLGGRGDDTYDLREQEELTVEAAFTALGGGHRQQGFIYNANNFPISFDTFRRFVFDRLTPELDEFGLEIVTDEDSDELLGEDGFPLLRQIDYPLQILDAGGIDNLILEGVEIEAASIRQDRLGVAQRGDSLVIDYNQDSYPSLENDIVIDNFFDLDNPGEAGTGFIETLDGIDSSEILALAQPFTPIDLEIPEVETGFWTNSGVWGDYDNDGDLDLAIASGDDAGNGFTRIYRNDEGVFNFAASLEGYSEVTSFDWGDYDGDGDLDVLIVGKDGQPGEDIEGNFFSNSDNQTYKAAVFANEGGDRFSDVEAIDLESVANGEPLFATWGNYVTTAPNTDNRLDILLRGSAIPTSNDSSITIPEWGYDAVIESTETGFGEVQPWQLGVLKNPATAIGNSGNATNAWGDYNNDGDLDVVVIDDTEITVYIDNEPVFGIGIENQTEAGRILKSSVVAGDYDNDGNLDLLTTTYTEDDRAEVTVYVGDGEGEFTAIPTLIPNLYNGEASWGDYDNDGDLDILLIGTGGRDSSEGLPFAQVYRNNTAATPNTAPTAPDGLRTTAESILGYDGEAIRFQWGSATDTEINDTSLTYNLRIGTTPGGSEILAAGSIDENGRLLSPEIGNIGINQEYILDISSGLEPGVTYYWSVQAVDGGYLGSEFATESSFTYLPYQQTDISIDPVSGNAAWGDYDNDGDLDLIKGTSLFDNNLGESETIFAPAVDLAEDGSDDSVDNAWGDYDGDGDLDLAVTGNTTAIYRNDANDTDNNEDKFVSLALPLPQTNNGTVAWGDYDNDGDLDLFLTGIDDDSLVAQIQRNEGELGFILDEAQNEIEGLTNGDAAWGDYDNDGDLDLAVTGTNEDNITVAGIYVNNLGILEEFIPLQPASNFLSDNNPNSISWGDYDGDGYLDLLVTANTDSSSHQIYRNDRNGNFIDINATEIGATAPNGKSAWADINNDGQLDIILSGEQQAAFENQNGSFQRTYFRDDFADDLETTLAVADYDNDGDLDYLANQDSGFSADPAPAVYENLLQDRVNELPIAPTELTAATNKNSVTLEWNLGSDEETPVEGLTYNLRVGTTPGGNDIVASMSNSEGLRSLIGLGNVNYNTEWQLSDLANGTYYWSVQTIDSTSAGSTFSDEGEFTISNPQIEIENIEIEERDTGEVEAEFTVTLNVETLTEPITVDYATANGTAIAGEDYEATSGTLTFNLESEDNPVELSKIIKVNVLGDRNPEEDETFTIQLSNVSDNAEILTSAATATIESENTDGQALLPDYSFAELTINNAQTNISIARGSTINLEGVIANLTEFTPETPPSYRLYLSQDETIDTDLESSQDITLATDNSNTQFIEGEYIFNETNVSIPATVSEGEYFLIAQVNPESTQEETELNNNVLTVPVSVVTPTDSDGNLLSEAEINALQSDVAAENRAEIQPELLDDLLVDLAVSEISLAPSQNNEITVSFTVSTQGNSNAIESDTWVTQIYLSDDNIPDAGDLLLTEQTRSEVVQPNSSQIITDTVEFPNSISGGEYLFVVASPIEQLDLESDNNIGIVPFDI